jgi:uncharacterized membrane protein
MSMRDKIRKELDRINKIENKAKLRKLAVVSLTMSIMLILPILFVSNLVSFDLNHRSFPLTPAKRA